MAYTSKHQRVRLEGLVGLVMTLYFAATLFSFICTKLHAPVSLSLTTLLHRNTPLSPPPTTSTPTHPSIYTPA